MNDSKLLLSIYSPVYVYSAIVLYFIVLIAVNTPSNSSPSISSFYRANKSTTLRLLFILTLASMLGTPPTLGFFAKLLTFYLLAQNSNLALFAAIGLTLVLLTFYLQSIRASSTLRRKVISNTGHQANSSTAGLVYTQMIFILFTVTLPYLFDIFYCFFI